MGFIGDLGLTMPSVGNFSSFGTSMMFALLAFIIILFLAIIGYFIWDWKIHKYKIEIFENLGGNQYVRTGFDRARTIKVGDGGEEILKLKRRKCFRTAYGKKMGRNTYWFAIGQDGYWYNVLLGDLDAKQGKLDIEPIDRDMRYMHVAIRKNIQERYRKRNWFAEHGVWIMGGIFLLIMLAGIWFLLDKMGDINAGSAASLQAAERLAATNKDIVVALDNLINGRSGLVPAG